MSTPRVLSGTYVELWDVPSWRRKLGIGDASQTLTQRIEMVVVGEGGPLTGPGSVENANDRLAAFATLEEAGYIVQTSTFPPAFAGRRIYSFTDNQIHVTNGTGINGDTLLQLPQDIHEGATPEFLTIKPSLLSADFVTYVNAVGELASTTVTAAALASAVTADVLTTRGDLLSHDGATYIRVPVGAANTVTRTDGLDVLWGKVVLTTDVTGILPVANGGTNASSWTAGSVIFAGAGGTALAQDPANLFYDDALNRFGVGTNAPLTLFHVAKDSNVLGASFANSPIRITGATDTTKALYFGVDTTVNKGFVATFAGGGWVDFIINLAGGNVGVGLLTPLSRVHATINDAVVTVTDVLRLNHSLNTGGTAANFGTGILLTGETSTTDAMDMARIQTIWTDSTHATRTSALQFQTVNSAGALATRMTLTGVGRLGIGTPAPGTTLEIVGDLTFGTAAGRDILFGDNLGAALEFKEGATLYQRFVTTNAAEQVEFHKQVSIQSVNLIVTSGNTGLGTGAGAPGALLDLGLAGTRLGVMRLAGSTSGNVTIQPAVAAGTWTLTLPVNDGAANEFLQTDGAGVTSWSSVDLTTDVTGILPIANGGTNATTGDFYNSVVGGNIVFFDGTRLRGSGDANLTWDYTNSTLITYTLANAGWPALSFSHISTAASASHTIEIAGSFGASGGGTQGTAFQIIASKEQVWGLADSTHDSRLSFLTTLDNVAGEALDLRSSGSIICGKDATGTTRVDDFLYIPSSAGNPTGVAEEYGSRVPINYDTTGNYLDAYNPTDNTWRRTVLTPSGVTPIANGGTNASSFATVDGLVRYDGTSLVTTTYITSFNGQTLDIADPNGGAGIYLDIARSGATTNGTPNGCLRVFDIATSATAALTRKLIELDMSGSNTGAGSVDYGLEISGQNNTETQYNIYSFINGTDGTNSTNNYGIYSEAIGGVNSYALRARAAGGTTLNYALYIADGATRLGAGAAAANHAPLKFVSGTDLTTPEAGAMEYGGRFTLTDTDAVRRHIVQAVNATKTTAGAPYANDGYVEMVINGTTLRVMTTA